VLAAGSLPSAHRRDEYLQAARLAIDPARVQIELDLTPGIAVAGRVLAEIDLDRSTSISPGEGRTYCARLLREIAVDVDGMALALELADCVFPDAAAVLNGEGTIRLSAVAATPGLAAGTHQLRYRNSHRAEIGAYLVNALVPASSRVTVGRQRRDALQRDVTVDYTLEADAATRRRGGLVAGVTAALFWLGVVWWRRRRPSAREAS
jgi:hypothetical protein